MFKIKRKGIDIFFSNLLLYILITVVGGPLVIYFKTGSIDVEKIGWILLPFFLVFFLIPTLSIHLNYLFKNKGIIVFYDEPQMLLRVTDKGKEVTFGMGDILSVTEYKTYPKAENRNSLFPWDDYHYSLVELKNGEKFYFTSLILPNLNLPVDKSKVTLKKRFYPAIG